MEAAANFSCRHPLLRHNRLSFSTPIPSISYRPPPSPSPSPSLKSALSVQASASSSNHDSFQTKSTETSPLNPISSSLVKSAFVATATVIAAATVFLARSNLKFAVAAPFSPPSGVEAAEKEDTFEEEEAEREKGIEEFVNANPNDVQALRELVEAKVKNKKMEEAIAIVKRLIELEPGEQEWILLKAQLHCYNEEFETAENEFNEIVAKDPIQAEAYHGLVMIASQSESGDKLKELEQRAMKAMEVCRKENKKEELGDFKLLIAQIRVIGGDYNGALSLYEDIVKDNPRDFRPYLCQGIIYTLLRKTDEAEKQFQKYRRLVPRGHPYTEYFDNNMMATKLFAQKIENEGRVRRS